MIFIASLLAEIMVFVHWLWLFIVISGTFLAVSGKIRLNLVWQNIYLLVLGLTISSNIYFQKCLLTDLEKSLRLIAGQSVNNLGFIQSYFDLLGVYISADMIFVAASTIMIFGLFSMVFWNLKGGKYAA